MIESIKQVLFEFYRQLDSTSENDRSSVAGSSNALNIITSSAAVTVYL